MTHMMYAVTIETTSSKIVKFSLNGRLTELDADAKVKLAFFLAETAPSWKYVINGTLPGVVFDGETLDCIPYNRGPL